VADTHSAGRGKPGFQKSGCQPSSGKLMVVMGNPLRKRVILP
jgi:hypothetical protein